MLKYILTPKLRGESISPKGGEEENMETRKKKVNFSYFAGIAGLLLIMMMSQGCDLLTSYGYVPKSGFVQFESMVPAYDKNDPVGASHCELIGDMYTDVDDGGTLSLRVASSMTDYITAASPGTVMTDTNGFTFRYGLSTFVAWCYWPSGSSTASYSPSQCKRGVIEVNTNASVAPYFEYAGSRASGSVNIPQLGKVKIKATTAGATVYGIWKYGANASNIPTSSEWDACIHFAQNELEMPLDFMGATYGTLFAREKDVGKDRSTDNTMITAYKNDTPTPTTNYNLTVTYTSTVLGTRNYFVYLASLASASYTATRTAIYSNQNVAVATIPNGFYAINVRSDPDGAWAFPQTGTSNFSVLIAGVKITVKGPSGDGFFTVKNGVVYDGFVN